VKTTLRLTAALSAVALLAAACGDDPDDNADAESTATEGDTSETEEPMDDATEPAADFVGCMVSDEGGVNDKSFNETSWNGLLAAETAGTISSTNFAESNSDSDYAPNVDAMVAEDCGIIVTVGFLLAGATQEAATANPEETFTIVDYMYSEAVDGVASIDNVKPLVFNTQEAAFLAGYAAASYSKTGTVGTWGGLPIPTVTIFMDGFYDGVMYYNEQKGAEIEVLGWDKEAQDGQFVGDFSNTGQALQISQNMISQGADVLHPVAGQLAESAGQAAQEAGDVTVIWADSDGFESAPDFGDVILTSVLKNMDTAVQNAVETTAAGEFSNEPFVGTLENDGVGIAPFHDFEGEVSDETKQELEAIKQLIISGELTVESDAAF
jgi:basic membrane protein A